MNIVCCTDHNYIMPAGVMICSVCVNHLDCEVTFHVVCNDDVTEEDKDDLRIIVNKYHHKIIFYPVNISIPSCFTTRKDGQYQHVTIASYYRLFLTEILPIDLHKILYLDVDLVVRHSLLEMYNTNINDCAIGVVPDRNDGNIHFYNRLRYLFKYGYFNAGVLLINLDYWRTNNILIQSIDYATKYPDRITFHDQDILNCLLYDKKIRFHLKYNFSTGLLDCKLPISWEYEAELEEAIKDPFILHFTRPEKPWHEECDHPYKNEFIKYKKMTKWADEPLRNLYPITIRRRIKKILIFMGILKRESNQYISVSTL